MMVEYNTAVRADGNVDARLFKVFIAGGAHLDERRGLAAADALGFAGDADGTAADANLYEVGPVFREEQKSVPVDDVARTDLYLIAVL